MTCINERVNEQVIEESAHLEGSSNQAKESAQISDALPCIWSLKCSRKLLAIAATMHSGIFCVFIVEDASLDMRTMPRSWFAP